MDYFKYYVLIAFTFAFVVGTIAYSSYQSDLLRLQEPVVETCVQHRVSQHITLSN